MKKKSVIILFLVIALIFMIYIKTKDTDVYYLNIGDEYLEEDGISFSSQITKELKKSNKLEKFVEFQYDDYRITDLLNAIRDNAYIYINEKKQTIQNALIKADVTTIWIGMNDFKYGLMKENKEDIYNYMDTLLLDIENFLTEVKNYTKEEVFFVGYYTTEEDKKIFAEYLNGKVEKLCKKKGIHFIKIDRNIKEDNEEKMYNDIAHAIFEKFTFS